MNYSPTIVNRQGTFEQLSPLKLLAELADSQANGYLQVFSNQVFWLICFEQGKIIYASYSIKPLERLDRNLRRLGHKVTEVLKEVYFAAGLNNNISEKQSFINTEYSTVCALVNQKVLDAFQAAELVDELVKEVVELFSWIQQGSFNFINQQIDLPRLARVEVKNVIEYCQERLQYWQSLKPKVWSPYQGLYLFRKNQSESKILQGLERRLGNLLEERLWTLLKGLNFRQIAALLNQNEIKLAQCLHPYIIDGTIMLRDPKTPFEQLPKIPELPSETKNLSTLEKLPIPANQKRATKYTVVCVDDSPSILNEIYRFLDGDHFSVVAINNPVKAIMEILKSKPDIILLDVGMPHLDGYELCRMIRNNSMFKNTPIVMVTGNTGIIDRAKAKVVGASGYLTKPFTQSDLLKTMFKHLN